MDVNGVIHDAVALLQAEIGEQGAPVRLELADALPPVLADPIQIQQVVLNLARNGIEAINASSSPLQSLTLHTSMQGDDAVEVAVRDSGQGIPAEVLEQAFNPFFTTKASGLGLGLSISRSIVEAHGGRLSATPEGGRGTVFRFYLPVCQETRSDAA